jgi:predicted RNA binding protein YcfA (HicA-like mRNA interferase family)
LFVGWNSKAYSTVFKIERPGQQVVSLKTNRLCTAKEKGSIRYYGKRGHDRLVRIDYHGSKEIPTGTCNSILKAARVKK